MKESELETLKWDAAAEVYRHDLGGVVMRAQSVCGLRFTGDLTTLAIKDAARIAEHYSDTGRFGPDPEEPTREQVGKWLATDDGWVWAGDANKFRKPGNPICVSTHDRFGVREIIDAIALIESRDPEDIRREMVEL